MRHLHLAALAAALLFAAPRLHAQAAQQGTNKPDTVATAKKATHPTGKIAARATRHTARRSSAATAAASKAAPAAKSRRARSKPDTTKKKGL
jgi:hypothetical protein